ncbi:glycosyltransferase [Candidatus Lokiarchaeum ossiferum]|uniref:glycosyltransferase n=1 Tax=Candidatus Lokiarchaeum ossiferum TaxID=2951803 RepID=UPI00352C2FAD
MKINILFPFKDKPWGGANQFLKALKNEFLEKKVYSESPEDADIILFNLNPSVILNFIPKVWRLKKKNPNLVIVVRIDGPIFLIRDRDLNIDKLIFTFSSIFADGVIFQSNWSKMNCFKLGMTRKIKNVTILNAPDNSIFNSLNKREFSLNDRIRIIATSWSDNLKKGFEEYKWLDDNLDHSFYEMTFVGNTPIKFKNIKHIQPLSSQKLSLKLKENDIFITASKKDPCSNSLIEAMHCGLPAIAFKDGGHPEIVKDGGEIFNTASEIPLLITTIVNNYEHYRNSINLPTIKDVGNEYYEFISQLYNDMMIDGLKQKKKISYWNYILLKIRVLIINFEKLIKMGFQKLNFNI